jgi:hypothetical protein
MPNPGLRVRNERMFREWGRERMPYPIEKIVKPYRDSERK